MPRFDQSPAKIHAYLNGVQYPARKTDLIEAARRNEAPTLVIKELENIPDQRFQQPNDVTQAMANGQQG